MLGPPSPTCSSDLHWYHPAHEISAGVANNCRLSASFRTYLCSPFPVLFRTETSDSLLEMSGVHTQWIDSSYRPRVRLGLMNLRLGQLELLQIMRSGCRHFRRCVAAPEYTVDRQGEPFCAKCVWNNKAASCLYYIDKNLWMGFPFRHVRASFPFNDIRTQLTRIGRFSRKEACSQPPKRGILSLTGLFADDEVIESKPMPSKAPSQRYRGVLAWRFQSSYRRRDWRGFDELLPSSVPPEDDYLFPG